MMVLFSSEYLICGCNCYCIWTEMKPAILAVDDPDVLKAVERDLRQIQPILAQDRCFSGQSKDRVSTEMLCLDLVDREAEKEIVKEVKEGCREKHRQQRYKIFWFPNRTWIYGNILKNRQE
jgi:hypothetical protein